MAVRGISLAETEILYLDDDPARPDNPDKNELAACEARGEKPTQFVVGPLTHDDKIELGDLDAALVQTEKGMQMTMRNTERGYMIVARALREWKDYLDDNGNQLPFTSETAMVRNKPRKIASSQSLGYLRRDHVMELARKITTMNGMKTDLEKKLDGLFSQQDGVTSETGDATTSSAPLTNGDGVGADSPAN